MSAPIRVRKAKYSTAPRPWIVWHNATILVRYQTGDEALAFLRRLLKATG